MNLPGSAGEHQIQRDLGTEDRARSCYDQSMKSELTDRMISFVEDRIVFLLSTADSNGETDCSPRVGPRGFVEVVDGRLYYPECRANGLTRLSGICTRTRTRRYCSWTGGTRRSASK